MKKKILFIILLLSFSLYLNLTVLHSEVTQQTKNQEALNHEVTVTLKLIQVFVTDKEGNPVTDLEKSDFILYDNGKLKTITDFEKHFLAKPDKKITPSPKTPSRMNRKFFIILDIQRNDEIGLIESKKAALHFIDTQISPDDEIGVLAYSPITGIDLHLYLTVDHQKVREVIKGLKEAPGDPSAREVGMRQTIVVSSSVEAQESTGSQSQEQSHSNINILPESLTTTTFSRGPIPDPRWRNVARKPTDFIVEIKELAKALRYIPGYKNIILFSGGFAKRLFQRPGFRMIFEDMSKELATSNSPVYSVNAKGTRDHFKGSQYIGYDSLKVLADITGGKYFEDVEHYEEIASEIQNITSNYYVLGYYIGEKWDGRYHEIKVEVKREGCRVHAQGGYFNPKPFTTFSEIEKQLHLVDIALSEKPYFQEPFNFPLITLPCSHTNESNALLLSEIDVEKIKEVTSGNTEVVTLIFGEDNTIVDSSKAEVSFSSIPQKKIYQYSIASLQTGKYECRVVIRNLKTGKAAVGSSSVDIPELQDSGIKLYPPLLLIPEKNASYLRTSKARKEETEKKPLSINDIYPFLSNKHSPLVEELDKGISKLFAVVRSSIFNIKEPEIELSVYLIDHSKREKTQLSFSILSSKNKGETDILLMEIEMPELKPGRYSLEIGAEELSTKSESKATRNFTVK